MALALTLGRRGRGNTWPNPAVGCVLVNQGRIVGRGWTQRGGRPHAETVALAQAGNAARGATAYVTLEPCAHHGQTPPCAEALVKAGVARVVAAIEDNDARVAGRGFEILRAAGITVDVGVCADEAARDLRGFILRTDQGRPFVTLKLAATLDGRIATATGESQWITGPDARREVHAMRAAHDVVLVGGGTARADDPSLTVRGLGIDQQPVRVVASRRLDLPLLSTLARTATEVPVWIAHGSDADPGLVSAWHDLGAELLACDVEGAQLSPASILQALGAKGVNAVFCEGGGALAASLISADLVDELVMFHAGFAIGAEGYPAVGALGLDRLSGASRFRAVSQRRVGADLLSVWRRGDG